MKCISCNLYVPGGKRTQVKYAADTGKMIRIWDVNSYPRDRVVHMVIANIVGLAMTRRSTTRIASQTRSCP